MALTVTVTEFDKSERRIWAGRGEAYAASFAKLCAHAVPDLLDAAAVGAGTRLLDVGTGPGAAAVAAFDATVANFVLNHVGQPRAALAELRRVTRPGGRVAVTVWTAPAAGQALLGRAVAAAGVSRPAHLPALAAEDDFARTEEGLAALLAEAGLTRAGCRTLRWEHRATPAEWWSGPAGGVATIGQVVTGRPPEVVAEIKGHFDMLCEEFMAADGMLALPHTALLAWGRA